MNRTTKGRSRPRNHNYAYSFRSLRPPTGWDDASENRAGPVPESNLAGEMDDTESQ